MNYLVLHIDLEFIVGIVCANNGNSYPVTNGRDDLLWLYFFNDPRSNKITFGKGNRDNANKETTNYYGKFFNIITDGYTTFKSGEFQKNAIELLQYSNLLKTVKDKFADVTKECDENIPTLLTFSMSISDLAKQKTVDYFKSQGFQINYTIPLAELVGYYPFSKKEFVPANGSPILLLAATNATLHIVKLGFSNDYFILNGNHKYEGMGIDPRKRAIVGYVVNQINISVGALNSNEISAEIEKKEFKADEWLRKLDAKGKNDNSPIRITESLSPMPSSMRDVLVKKSDIETFTNDFVNVLMEYFNAYKSKNINGDIAGIFLLGDCFNNSLIKQRFNNLFRDDNERKKKLFAYTNKDIQNILSVYPKIAAAKAEQNRKDAQDYYNKAVDLVKGAEVLSNDKKLDALENAVVNIEIAISLDKENTKYQQFANTLRAKIKELNDKIEKYKSWRKDAENYEQSGNLDSALKAYKNAQEIIDSKELREKIAAIKKQLQKKAEIEQRYKTLIQQAKDYFSKGAFNTALSKYEEALEIKPDDAYCLEQTKRINDLIQQNKNREKAHSIVVEADTMFEKKQWENAKHKYLEALELCPNDATIQNKIKECEEKIKKIEDTFKDLLFEAIVAEKKKKFRDALLLLEEALEIKPYDRKVIKEINRVKNLIKFEDFGSKKLDF
jgi:tetratricopeptide (TPR) repeat protein